MDWTSRWFFVFVLTFLIFVVARGDASKWKQIFTVANPSPGLFGGNGNTAIPTNPFSTQSPSATPAPNTFAIPSLPGLNGLPDFNVPGFTTP